MKSEKNHFLSINFKDIYIIHTLYYIAPSYLFDYSNKYPDIKIKKPTNNPPKIRFPFCPPVIAFPPRPYFKFSLNPESVSVSAIKYFLFAPH